MFTSFSRFVSKRDGQRGVCRSSSLCGLRELANHRKFETLRSVVIYLSEDEGVYVCVTYRKERQPFSWGQLNEFFFRLLREGEEELKKELYIIYKKPKKERRLKNKREEKREKINEKTVEDFQHFSKPLSGALRPRSDWLFHPGSSSKVGRGTWDGLFCVTNA